MRDSADEMRHSPRTFESSRLVDNQQHHTAISSMSKKARLIFDIFIQDVESPIKEDSAAA
jgi:hypothetical protein